MKKVFCFLMVLGVLTSVSAQGFNLAFAGAVNPGYPTATSQLSLERFRLLVGFDIGKHFELGGSLLLPSWSYTLLSDDSTIGSGTGLQGMSWGGGVYIAPKLGFSDLLKIQFPFYFDFIPYTTSSQVYDQESGSMIDDPNFYYFLKLKGGFSLLWQPAHFGIFAGVSTTFLTVTYIKVDTWDFSGFDAFYIDAGVKYTF